MVDSSKSARGFTLIELLVVVAIIGILAAIAVPFFIEYRTKTADAAALTDLKNAKSALEGYCVENKIYP